LPTNPTPEPHCFIPSSPNQPASLEYGEVWVEYHPSSGKKPEILHPDHSSQPPTAPVLDLHNTDLHPWHPFHSWADFEQAELFLRYNCTDSFIDSQLKIIHSGSPHSHSVTLKSAKQMHNILAEVPRIKELPGVCVLHQPFQTIALTTQTYSSEQ
jgi:hypothetical protein